MALHFDLKVNHETIGTFYARRLNPEPEEINAYEWRVIEGDEMYQGIIEHRFKDGAWTLVQLILGEVERQKQERIAYSLEA